jgi:hypothetical protein
MAADAFKPVFFGACAVAPGAARQAASRTEAIAKAALRERMEVSGHLGSRRFCTWNLPSILA